MPAAKLEADEMTDTNHITMPVMTKRIWKEILLGLSLNIVHFVDLNSVEYYCGIPSACQG